MKISSISYEIGAIVHPATSTKRAVSTAGGPAISADSETDRSKQLVNAAALGTPKVPSNSGEADDVVAPVVDGFKFLVQGLKFSVDEETGRKVIKVVDVKTGKLIRQIPPEDVLSFLRQLEDHKGLMLSIKS